MPMTSSPGIDFALVHNGGGQQTEDEGESKCSEVVFRHTSIKRASLDTNWAHPKDFFTKNLEHNQSHDLFSLYLGHHI